MSRKAAAIYTFIVGMYKVNMVFLSIILILFVAAAAILFLGWFYTQKLLKFDPLSRNEIWDQGMEEGWIEDDNLRAVIEEFQLTTSTGDALEGFFIPGSVNKTVVFCHGRHGNCIHMIKYFPVFLKRNWNIVAYDNRGHGDSYQGVLSYGFHEKDDLAQVMSWVRDKFSESEIIGVYGESMGAATVMEYAPIDKNLDFVVGDCGYSDFEELLIHQMKLHHLPCFLHNILLIVVDYYIRKQAGFSINQVSPIREIQKTEVPLMLFHGGDDNFVPTEMSCKIMEERGRRNYTDLCIIDGATHAKSVRVNPRKYNKRLDQFITYIETHGKDNQ